MPPRASPGSPGRRSGYPVTALYTHVVAVERGYARHGGGRSFAIRAEPHGRRSPAARPQFPIRHESGNSSSSSGTTSSYAAYNIPSRRARETVAVRTRPAALEPRTHGPKNAKTVLDVESRAVPPTVVAHRGIYEVFQDRGQQLALCARRSAPAGSTW